MRIEPEACATVLLALTTGRISKLPRSVSDVSSACTASARAPPASAQESDDLSAEQLNES
jgi:hypothetical protein